MARRTHPQMTVWMTPLLYAVGALAVGLALPRFEARIFPEDWSPMSSSASDRGLPWSQGLLYGCLE